MFADSCQLLTIVTIVLTLVLFTCRKENTLKSALWLLLCLVANTGLAVASPATFVTALPVAKDQLLLRFNAQPVFSTRGFHSVQFPVNVGYGFNSRLAFFANVSQGFASLNSLPPATGRLSSGGLNDMVAYARYTLVKIDKPKSTFRIAPLAGAFIPTGDNSLRGPQGFLPRALQTGSGTLDSYMGITMGYNSIRWGMAVDSTYRINPVAGRGISPGNQYRSDAQVEYKILPLRMPEEGLPKLLVLSIESNYTHESRDRLNGVISTNSGGNILKQDAVLEISTFRWQIGLGAQFPVMQDLAGNGRIKQRSGFFLFFEYYLAAPNWRHRKDVP